MAQRTFGYFGRGGELFGVFHAPAGESRDTAVLLCPPLGAEGLSMHRVVRHWAARLQAAGFPVLRFDYRGTGDSAGDETSGDLVASCLESTEEAVRALRAWSGRPHVYLGGLRMGANLALETACRVPCDGLLLWGACGSGRAFARQLQLLSVAEAEGFKGRVERTDGSLTAGGFVWTKETLEGLGRLDAKGSPLGSPKVLFMRRDDVADAAKLEQHLQASGANVSAIDTEGFAGVMAAPHNTVVPFSAIDASVEWLLDVSAPWEGVLDMRGVMDARILPGREQRDRVVRFGPEGRLFGILSEPLAPTRRNANGVVVLAGSVHRIGHNRMNVELANRLVANGFVTLRMDTGGLGDSEVGEGGKDNDPYPPHIVDDVLAGVELLQRQAGASKAILTGLCAGAYASFHGGMENDAVAQGILVNPLTFYWKPGMSLDPPTSGVAADVAYYRHASRDWRRWVRLLFSPGRVLRAAGTVAARLWSGFSGWLDRVRGKRDPLEVDIERFVAGGRRLSFVLAVGDAGYDILMMHAKHLCARLVRKGRMDMVLIQDANHAFTDPIRREEMFDAVLRLAISGGQGRGGAPSSSLPTSTSATNA